MFEITHFFKKNWFLEIRVVINISIYVAVIETRFLNFKIKNYSPLAKTRFCFLINQSSLVS
jgi:hypothetical protein